AEAHLICSRLRAAGIPAIVQNELSAMIGGGLSLEPAGIRIEVPATQAAAARELLGEPGE
ncbi:MAG: DUF2007 domain-containing protein, partial [Verrucomicrobiota bacterium]|nr:DUF2007 domain-containing protein [Verrucomicrobiota bacterium]